MMKAALLTRQSGLGIVVRHEEGKFPLLPLSHSFDVARKARKRTSIVLVGDEVGSSVIDDFIAIDNSLYV